MMKMAKSKNKLNTINRIGTNKRQSQKEVASLAVFRAIFVVSLKFLVNKMLFDSLKRKIFLSKSN